MAKKKQGSCPICQKGSLKILDHTFYQCNHCNAQIQMKLEDKNRRPPPKYKDDWEDEDDSYEDDDYGDENDYDDGCYEEDPF